MKIFLSSYPSERFLKMAKYVGAHLSISKGLYKIQKQMDDIDADACAIFLKNQRTYNFKPIADTDVEKFKNIKNPELVLPHSSYLINLANDAEGKAYRLFLDDLERCEKLNIPLYNMHPGSNTIKDYDQAIQNIIDGINKAISETRNVIVCIENMAGQGNVLGKTFKELHRIIEGIENKERIGVVLDTCHLFGAGYDVRTYKSFEKVMQEFDKVVGHKYLKGMHLNDSKMDLGTKKDRHEQLGKGKIGLECFKYIMNSQWFEDIPMILETPDDTKYKEEISLLKSFIGETHSEEQETNFFDRYNKK